jgi:hypothetical protein
LCAVGALYAASGIEPEGYGQTDGREDHWSGWNEEGWEATSRAQCALEDALNRWPPDWNDAPERTKEEVISTLRAAAQAARAEQ